MANEVLLFAARSTVVMAIGLVATALLRRRSAALRHRVLVLAFAASMVVGPLAAVVPTWSVPLPGAVLGDPPTTIVDTPAMPSGSAVSTASGRTAPESTGPAIAPPDVLLGLWLAGACLAILRLVGGCLYVSRLGAAAAAPADTGWQHQLEQVSQGHGLARAVRVGVTDRPDVLATFGAMNPTVLLPAGARSWSSERLRVVLLHELAHIKRADWGAQLFAETVRALHWFNPLFWLACARLRDECERACDDEVLAHGVPPDTYAEHLIEIARTHRHSPWAVVVPMARPSTLERRVTAMLSPRIDRRAPGRGAAVSAVAAVAIVMMLVAGLTPSAQSNALSVRGRVFDPSGGVLPGASVALIDQNKISWPTTTDRTGQFTFEPVGAGPYVLEVTLVGFKSLRHEFNLASATGRTHTVTLQVGTLEETIRVSAKRPAAQATAPARPAPIRVGGNIKVPTKLVDVHPVYPEAMREAGLEGIVPMEAVIGVDGSVVSVHLSSAQINPEFAASAVTAVRQWRFSPTLLNGVPVEVQMSVSVSFGLTD